MTKKRDDYDNPWKKAISLYFPDFMAFFFPQIYSEKECMFTAIEFLIYIARKLPV
jgi:hypothetical protein